MVHRWGSQNKDFSAGSQTDFNRSLVPSVAQATSGPGWSKQGKDKPGLVQNLNLEMKA